jgi:hypothetical protein
MGGAVPRDPSCASLPLREPESTHLTIQYVDAFEGVRAYYSSMNPWNLAM